MDCTTSSSHSSSSNSPSSVESVLSTISSPPSIYPSHLIPYLLPTSTHLKENGAKRFARKFAKRLSRLEARLTPSGVIAQAEKRIWHKQFKECEKSLLKEACVKRELKRAKRTATFLTTFPTIDIHHDSDQEYSACEQVIITQDSEIGAEIKAIETDTFAGLVVIQDRLSAMRQALSEHAKDGKLGIEPGRHSYHVDAAVFPGMAGVAVVHKMDRQYWASPWIAKGYCIPETLDQEDAELWAVWQALQTFLEQAHADRAKTKPQDPCSLAVVYSDCAYGLRRVKNAGPAGGLVVQKIIAQSMELQRLGVDIHLHWVPGHRNIPGNELADDVA